jgi:uncharacterized membrane protein YeaQ/YmgE (transglycosylase-associated protein family)
MAKTEDPAKQSRRQQLVASYRMTKEQDPKIGLVLGGTFLLVAAVVFVVLYFVQPSLVFAILIGVLAGILAALIVFGRRAQKAMYAQIEGQPGAAAAVLGSLRKGWKTDPAIAFNRNQDLVHRVVGPPGIVLVGEGNPNRLRSLLANERRKHERVVAETPVHEVIVGDGPGQVPVNKLTRHVSKMRRELKPAEMTDVLARLRALDANRSNIPLPKGPVPTSMKGMRGNLRGR